MSKDFVVAIDVGHSIKKPGVISSRGIGEFYFNQNVARLLLKELTSRGFTNSFLINQDSIEISLTERADIANSKKADLLISIHHDSVQPHYLSTWNYQGKSLNYSDMFKGYSLFYSEKNEKPDRSMSFARLLGEQLLVNGFTPTLHHAEKTKGENRDLVDREKGIYRFDDLVVLKKTKMPAVLLECGVIINREDEMWLSDPLSQRKLVQSIARAIERACKNK